MLCTCSSARIEHQPSIKKDKEASWGSTVQIRAGAFNCKMKKHRRNWYLGFLGFLGFLGIPGILTKDWIDCLWLVWFLWFFYFFSEDKKWR